MAYRVDSQQVTSYSGDVNGLTRTTRFYYTCVTPLLQRDYVHTRSLAQHYPASLDDSLVSPGGRWVAFKAKYVYGPEDLLVISSSTQ